MADIAIIFHWAPAVMDAMAVTELMRWHAMALHRFEKIRS
jgi:hypothetical protein